MCGHMALAESKSKGLFVLMMFIKTAKSAFTDAHELAQFFYLSGGELKVLTNVLHRHRLFLAFF